MYNHVPKEFRTLNDAAANGRLTLRDLGHFYLRRRYTILFYTLVFTLVASPVVAAFGLSGALIESLLAANLLFEMVSAIARKKSLVPGP